MPDVRAVACVVLLPSLLLVACSRSQGSSGTTTTTPPTTADGTTGGPAVTGAATSASLDFCALSQQLNATIFETATGPTPGQQFTPEQIQLFEQTKAAAPPRIADATATVLDTYTRRGYDPALRDDPTFTTAARQVDDYVTGRCDR